MMFYKYLHIYLNSAPNEDAYFQGRPVAYLLSVMHKCIMVKVGGSPKTKKNENRGNLEILLK